MDAIAAIEAEITYGDIFYTEVASVWMRGVSIYLSADPVEAPADGISYSLVTAWLGETASGVPISGAEVTFATTLGSIERTGYTDNAGYAHAYLTSPTMSGVAEVVGAYGLIAGNTYVTFGELSLSLSADPTDLPADGISSSTITAQLTEASSGVPIAGASVKMQTSLGTIASPPPTDQNGVTQAYLSGSIIPGTAEVICSYGTAADTVSVTFGGLNLTVRASWPRMIADGSSSQSIIATLLTEDNNPVCGVAIDFSATHGVITGNAVTDCRGMAEAVLTAAGYPATSTIVASFKDAAEAAVQVGIEDPVIDLKASPFTISANPSSFSLITAYVSFADGVPVPDNSTVSFSTSEGFIPGSAMTNSGIADVSLKPTGVASIGVTVTASCGDASASTQVVFAPDAPYRVIATATPTEVPGDGSCYSAITAEVTDAYGNDVEDGTLATFSVTGGSGVVTPSAVTASGTAVARFTAAGGGGITTVRVTSGAVSDDVQIGITSQSPGAIVADPDTAWISVGGTWDNSQAFITAHVFDPSMSPVEDGTDVAFTITYAPGGGEYIDAPTYGYGPVVKQTSGGMAAATINSGTKPGTLLMTISSGDKVATAVKVGIASGEPDSIFVTTGDVVVTEGCVYALSVSAIVRDKYNNPVENGTVVYFTLDRSDVGIINPEEVTGGVFPCLEFEGLPNKGVAHACLKYPTSSMNKMVNIIARCGQLESWFPTPIPMVEPVSVNVDAMPSSVSGSEGDSVGIYVTVNDECVLPISNAPVTFAVEGDGYVDPQTATTDESGFCWTTLIVAPGTGEGTITVKARIWMTDAEGETEVNIRP
jgi:adhesin/invasin